MHCPFHISQERTMDYHKIPQTKIDQLTELFKTVKIHAELDWEVNMAGNGTCPSAATNVLEEVFSILEIEPPEEPTEEEIAEVEEEGE